MSTVSAYEAKTHLSALLERAAAGEAITITKHGRPLARLVPVPQRADLAVIAAEMRSLRDSIGAEPFDVRTLIEEGRRY